MSDVSVVIPVRDGARYLAEALKSVLDQSLAPAEVIVVDDGSTDATPDVAARFGTRVRYLRQAPAGVAAAANRGADHARASLIAWLDADDLWVRDKLALQVAALAGDSRPDLVFGRVEQFHSPELDERARASLSAAPGTLVGYLRGAMLARREAMERVGAFDTRFRLGEFVDWHARAVDAGLRMAVVPQVVMRRRLHVANSSRPSAGDRVDYARVVRAAFDRRRKRAAEEGAT